MATTVATPAKWVGRARPSSGAETPATVTVVLSPAGYISATVGRVEQVAAGAGQQGGVAGLVAGIGLEILGRRELGRVDEEAGHHPVGLRLAQAHQRQVSVVQGAHGRHERHALARRCRQAGTAARRSATVRTVGNSVMWPSGDRGATYGGDAAPMSSAAVTPR